MFLEIVKHMLKAVVLLELDNSWTVQRIKGAGHQAFQGHGCVVGFFFGGGRLKEGGNQVPLFSKTPETRK